MKNISEIGRNVVIAGSLLLSSRAAVDAMKDGALFNVVKEEARITHALQEEYGITVECLPSPFSGGGFCVNEAKSPIGGTNEVKRLDAYNAAMDQEFGQIPDRGRVEQDVALFSAGLLTAAGLVFTKKGE